MGVARITLFYCLSRTDPLINQQNLIGKMVHIKKLLMQAAAYQSILHKHNHLFCKTLESITMHLRLLNKNHCYCEAYSGFRGHKTLEIISNF